MCTVNLKQTARYFSSNLGLFRTWGLMANYCKSREPRPNGSLTGERSVPGAGVGGLEGGGGGFCKQGVHQRKLAVEVQWLFIR